VSPLVREHVGIVLILVLAFVMRSFLSTWPSFWHDEYLSIYYYGNYYKSALAAIHSLAQNSVHPPLYQFILYHWMDWFGDSELATRTLSNLYVAGATLCLYAFTDRVYGRRVALAAALIFSLMYMSIRYAVEVRSYAQTLFLASLSSWLLFEFLAKLLRPAHWKALLFNQWFVLLTLANAALLLTHYYNVFFLGAQGLFVLIYFLTRHPRLGLITEVVKAAVVSAVPVLVLLSTWGAVMASMYSRYDSRGKYNAGFPSTDPWTMFNKFVLSANLKLASFGKWLLPAIAVLLVALALRLAWDAYRRGWRHVPDRTYGTLYLAIWAFVPCLLAFLLFFFASAERYSSRYFIFCTPPLAVLIVLAFEEGIRLLDGAVSRFTAVRPARHYLRNALIYAAIIALVIAVPGGRKAASIAKVDFRGTASRIEDIVRSDPEHSYILYEANWRATLDYYLSHFGRKKRNVLITVSDTVHPKGEQSRDFTFEAKQDEIRKHDYLIVAFTHKRLRGFPKSLKRLGELYTPYFKMLSPQGRGLIVYKTTKP